jgi:site-specific DNA recombinase
MTAAIKPAVLYARVSSKDQEKEGFSIPAQLKLLREYSVKNNLKILREFVDVETAKTTGRKQFGEMVQFFRKHLECRVVIVEKTDRLYRNFADYVTLEDLGVEIHLPKEGQVISKESKSQTKLVHGIQLVIARNYIENLREEVKKGMREKASQGIYPSRPPLGYANNKLNHTIEIDQENAPIAKRVFEIYATGNHSLMELRRIIRAEPGKAFQKGYLHKLLKNPFYSGFFEWNGERYKGTHALIVSHNLFSQVQAVLDGHNRPRYRKHVFPFRGLLTCAFDDCMITAETKKQKYTYYRCTGSKGRCELPYIREEELAERLGQVLKDIHIPDDVLRQLENSLTETQQNSQAEKKTQQEKLQQRLTAVRSRIDRAYTDKLDGKISEEFWQRKTAEWQLEEQQILMAKQGLREASPDSLLTAKRTLELANKACFLYVTQNPAEQAQLLKMVASNCRFDGVSLCTTYRKPFDVIFQRTKSKEWRARRDSNSRPVASEATALSN